MLENKYIQRACDKCKKLYMVKMQFWASKNRFMPSRSKYCGLCRWINKRKYHVKYCIVCGNKMTFSAFPGTLRKRKTCGEKCNITLHKQYGKSPHWQERTLSPKAIENKAIALFERAATGRNILGVNNYKAKYFIVMSPAGTIYKGKNIKDFVRNNSILFHPIETVWKKMKYAGNHPVHGGNLSNRPGRLWCRASTGLDAVLNGRRGSWKGWTSPKARIEEWKDKKMI